MLKNGAVTSTRSAVAAFVIAFVLIHDTAARGGIGGGGRGGRVARGGVSIARGGVGGRGGSSGGGGGHSYYRSSGGNSNTPTVTNAGISSAVFNRPVYYGGYYYPMTPWIIPYPQYTHTHFAIRDGSQSDLNGTSVIVEPEKPFSVNGLLFFWDEKYIPSEEKSAKYPSLVADGTIMCYKLDIANAVTKLAGTEIFVREPFVPDTTTVPSGSSSVAPSSSTSKPPYLPPTKATANICNVTESKRCLRKIDTLNNEGFSKLIYPDGSKPTSIHWLCPAESECCEWECCEAKSYLTEILLITSCVVIVCILLPFLLVLYVYRRRNNDNPTSYSVVHYHRTVNDAPPAVNPAYPQCNSATEAPLRNDGSPPPAPPSASSIS